MGNDDSDKPGSVVANALLAGYNSKPELLPIPAFRYAEPPEHQVSLRPRDALARLQLETGLAITQLQRELSVSRIVGIAEQAVWRRDGETSTSYYLIVPTWFWASDIRPEDDFWDTGFGHRFFPAKGYNADYDSWIKLFDVRFWFPGLDASSPQQVVAAAAEVSALPQLAKAEAERFSKALLQGWPNASETFAHQKAVRFFPEHKVPRDWFLKIFRAIRGPKRPGKSPKIDN